MGQKQKTEHIKNKEHEIDATKLQNAKCENSNEADIYGMKKKLRKYQQKCRKRPGVEATWGKSITNSREPNCRILRPENIHEKQIKNFKKTK